MLKQGRVGQTNYSAAKAGGIIGFTKALAHETASKNITVNCIAPGYIATEMVGTVPELKTCLQKSLIVFRKKRLGQPEEIARDLMKKIFVILPKRIKI